MKDLRAALGAPDTSELIAAPAPMVPFHQDGAGFTHLGPVDGCPVCAVAADAPVVDQGGDPDLDCPEWLPDDPAVPWHLRTPCHLSAGHRGDCDPITPELVAKALEWLATGLLRPMAEQDAHHAKAAYRAHGAANGVSGSLSGFLEGYVAGWASAWARAAAECAA